MLKVLIADDEVKVIQLIEHLVDWSAFHMEIIGRVNDGEKALEMIRREEPDVVVTDIRMPVINGIELVQKTQEAGLDPFFIMISGYSEFEYAQRAIQLGVEDYLLKPLRKKELEAVLAKIRDKAYEREAADEALNTFSRNKKREKELLITDILIHNRMEVFDLSEKDFQLRYGFHFKADYLECVIIRIFTGTNPLSPENPDVYRLVIPKLQEIEESRIAPKCEEYISTIHNNDILALISHGGDTKAAIMEELEKMKISLLSYNSVYPDLRIAIGISKPISQIRSIPKAYQDARSALVKRFLEEDGFIFLSDDYFQRMKPEKVLFSPQNQKQLLTKVELLDVPGFRDAAEQCFSRLKESASGPSDIQDTWQALCGTFLLGIHSFEEMSVSPADLGDPFQLIFDRVCTFSDLCRCFIDTCSEYLSRIKEEKKAMEDKPIRLAKLYIQEHFNEAISLEAVSSEVGFNPAYFSTVFKKSTGENFMDYVKEVRIEHAKEMLARTGMDIPSVAQAVGYSDIKYFTRLFRKLTSLTPTDYRKLYG